MRLEYPVARCTGERLMRNAGLAGITRAKGPRTTIAGSGPDSCPDLVERNVTATAPDQLWVADMTYIRTFARWVYADFVIDVFPAGWWAGNCRSRCAPTWRWIRWRWGSGPATAPVATSPG